MSQFTRKGAKALVWCVFALVFFHETVLAQATNEADALTAIRLATNPTSKLAAAEDFIARFPKSSERLRIAELIAGEMLKIKDGAVALALLERAKAIFTSEQEREILKLVALEAYAIGNRADDAFALAAEMLAKNPDDLHVLALMTHAGAEEARKKNRKYTDVSLQYGLKAIAIIEKDNRPASVDDETWLAHKANLGQLYQQTAILYLAAQNTDEAKTRLKRASELSPQDPSNFALLGRVINGDYLSQMKSYEEMPEGPSKQEALKRLEAVLDLVIDAYARAAGLATGRAEYQALLQQVIPDLTTYYKYRHKSTKGLSQLINQYRPKRQDF
jgi:tetratricopeptide (TPR) repeat protein